jgi:aryl-alcohol dehydrogenase-like predicted oxidoreductase
MTNLARRRLGETGLAPTVLGLGGAPLGDLFERLPERQADDIVQTA